MKYILHPNTEDIQLPSILHALSDPIRLNYVKELSSLGEVPCSSILAPVAKSTLSHHVRTLREAGVVRIRIQGKQHLVSIRTEELEQRFPGVLTAILNSTPKSPE